MRPCASYALAARIPLSSAADGPDCTVCTDGSVHEPVHEFHGDHRMPATERYRRQCGLMLWTRPGASRSSGRRQGRRYRDRVDSQGRCRGTFIAPTMLCLVAAVCYAAGVRRSPDGSPSPEEPSASPWSPYRVPAHESTRKLQPSQLKRRPSSAPTAPSTRWRATSRQTLRPGVRTP